MNLLSDTVNELIQRSDEDIRKATKEAKALAKAPATVGSVGGARAHIVLQIFCQQPITGFESHMAKYLAAVRTKNGGVGKA